ncbi:MAG: hypothetical protein NZ521_02860, partial [Flammeovirgaceae bacterium]|nr:hypothetical protein [Flammeovirgaceae bacterium]
MSKTKVKKNVSHHPFYYVKKRLLANKTAMFGLSVIVILTVIALLGYLIMPDSTPNANDGDITIAKKPPIFTVKMLKIKKDID